MKIRIKINDQVVDLQTSMPMPSLNIESIAVLTDENTVAYIPGNHSWEPIESDCVELLKTHFFNATYPINITYEIDNTKITLGNCYLTTDYKIWYKSCCTEEYVLTNQ